MRIAVNGVRLFVDVEGAQLVPDGPTMRERPTLVLLHGGPGADHSIFKAHMSPFAEQAQLIYYDHRGHGRSDEAPPEDWTLSQWADDVVGLLDALGLEKPMVLGASFGGFVAQAFAVTYPERVSKLVLMSTAPRFDIDLSVQKFTELGGSEIGSVARRWLSHGDDPEAEAEYIARCAQHYSVDNNDPTFVSRIIERPEIRRHFFAPGGESKTADFRRDLARIQCPTLVVHGAQDPILPAPLAREMHAALPTHLSQLHIVENAGHSFQDAADEWNVVLQKFLFGDEPLDA